MQIKSIPINNHGIKKVVIKKIHSYTTKDIKEKPQHNGIVGRTDVEAETPILWPPDVKRWLTWKNTDSGKEWGQEQKRMTEDEMIGWHHWLNGHGFGWTLGAGVGQGGLACCGSWGHKESDMTQWWNWTELNYMKLFKQQVKVVGCIESYAFTEIHSTESLYYEKKRDLKQITKKWNMSNWKRNWNKGVSKTTVDITPQ